VALVLAEAFGKLPVLVYLATDFSVKPSQGA